LSLQLNAIENKGRADSREEGCDQNFLQHLGHEVGNHMVQAVSSLPHKQIAFCGTKGTHTVLCVCVCVCACVRACMCVTLTWQAPGLTSINKMTFSLQKRCPHSHFPFFCVQSLTLTLLSLPHFLVITFTFMPSNSLSRCASHSDTTVTLTLSLTHFHAIQHTLTLCLSP